LLSDFIRTLYLDDQGVLWIGTGGGGLTRWEDGHLTNITTREGLPDDTISQILVDGTGRFWLGNNRGIACVPRNELEQDSAHKFWIYPQVYGRAEGMLSEECTSGGYPAGLKTASGQLWFSTLKGIVVVDPRPRSTAPPAPSVVLEEVLVDGVTAEGAANADARAVGVGRAGEWLDAKAREPRPPTARASSDEDEREAVNGLAAPKFEVSPGKHRIELRYTGLSFSAPERVRFRYRLEPLDTDWVEAGTRRAAFYNYLPPGNFAFRVIACNGEGTWNQTGASVALTVLPHFWQTWWFFGFVALALLGSVGGTVRLVEKRKLSRRLHQVEQERALERERTRIARDLHDDLGSSLTRISLLSTLTKADRENPAQVGVHAERLSESAAQTVRALEEIVWAVRPGSDSLQSLVEYIAHFANELFDGAQTRCRLDLPHDLPTQPLPPEMRHNLFLIVKEALTNALKHAKAKEVLVHTKVLGNSLEIVVADDGAGFDPVPGAPEEGKRNGLRNMRRRAEAVGATLTVQSAPGKGTQVRLLVKLCPSK
jgi:signal transduction histidine kinase